MGISSPGKLLIFHADCVVQFNWLLCCVCDTVLVLEVWLVLMHCLIMLGRRQTDR